MSEENEKAAIAIYVDSEIKKEIETFFLYNCRIKNYQEGYREVLALGFEKFKKVREEKK